MADDRKKRREGLPASGWVGLGLLVVVLAALVLWSLPKEGGPVTADDASAEAAISSGDGGTPLPRTGRLQRLSEASCELAVLTDKPEEQLKALANAEAIGKLFDIRFCALTCDAA